MSYTHSFNPPICYGDEWDAFMPDAAETLDALRIDAHADRVEAALAAKRARSAVHRSPNAQTQTR